MLGKKSLTTVKYEREKDRKKERTKEGTGEVMHERGSQKSGMAMEVVCTHADPMQFRQKRCASYR